MDDFRAVVAQQLVQGRAIGWMSPQASLWMNKTEHASTRRFLAAAASSRVKHAELLVHGRLWRPPTVQLRSSRTGQAVPGRCVADHGFDKKGPYSPPLLCCNVSAVVSAAWLTSDGEALGLIAVNHQAAAEAAGSPVVTLVAQLTTPRTWLGHCCEVTPASVALNISDDGRVTISLDVPSGTIDVVMLRPHGASVAHSAWHLKVDDTTTSQAVHAPAVHIRRRPATTELVPAAVGSTTAGATVSSHSPGSCRVGPS